MAPNPRSAGSMKRNWLGAKLSAPISRRLSGWFAGRLWFTPWVTPLPERALAKQQAWLGAASPSRFRTRHGTLSGYAAGDGPTVLLVHGWADTAATLGSFIGPLNEAGFRVVAFDHLSHGDSARKEPNVYASAETILDVAHLTKAVGVVAHSLGGVGTMLALKNGLDVRSVVLINPSSNIEHIYERFVTLTRLPEGARIGLREELERKFGRTVWTDLCVPALTDGIDKPALIIHDRDDEQVPFKDSKMLVSAWPGAELVVTQGLGHTRAIRDTGVIGTVAERLTADLFPQGVTGRTMSAS